MGVLDGGAHLLLGSRAFGRSLAPRVRHCPCESREVAATVRRNTRELSDHRFETIAARLSLPNVFIGSRVQPSERVCYCGQRLSLRLLLLLLLRLLLLLLLQLLLYFLLLLLLLLQLLLLLHLLLNLLLKLLLLLLHLHY